MLLNVKGLDYKALNEALRQNANDIMLQLSGIEGILDVKLIHCEA